MPRKRVEPSKEFGGPEDLLVLAKKKKDPKQSQRYLAIRMLIQGQDRETVMISFGISWSTLQKWVSLWNKGGKDKIEIGKSSGRPSKITPEAEEFLVEKIEFTHPRTGERITGIHLSGVLKKKVRDKIKQKCDLLSTSQNGLQKVKTSNFSDSKKRRKSK